MRIRELANRRIGLMLPLGFASGLPLALTSGTLQAWLTIAGVDLRTIGVFTLVGLPYTLKFLWAPLMDRYTPPWLGRRRGWMVLTQASLILGVLAMALIDPSQWPWLLGIVALSVAFMSASQDIVFDAYRTETLRPQERGLGAAVWVNGYRFALLIAGSMALVLADQIGWPATYTFMALTMLVGLWAVGTAEEPSSSQQVPSSLREAVLGPLEEFFSRTGAGTLLGLVALYKLGDAFAGTLLTAFLIKGVGFTATDVGIMKGLGLGLTLAGALIGGLAMTRLGLVRALLAFGLLQAVSNLAFVLLAWGGKSYPLLIFAIGCENLSGGMGTSAFVALVMALCHHKYTATQFALLSSIEAVGRVLLGRPSAHLVEAIGWAPYFVVTFIAALPGLLLLWHLRDNLARYEGTDNGASHLE